MVESMEEKPFLSIILPFYNAELSIRRSILSVVSQNFDDYELICINDGSTDKSLKIVKELREKYPQIKLIDKINEGVAETRNRGLRIAAGKYVLFLDSDDQMKSGLMAGIFHKLQDCHVDLVCFGYESIKEGKVEGQVVPSDKDIKNIEEIPSLYYKLIGEESFPPVWNKVYYLQIIKDYGIVFDKKLKYGEDYCFNLKYLLKCHSYVECPKIFYEYTVLNGTSITTGWDEKKYEKMRMYFDRVKEILEDYPQQMDNLNIWLQSFYIRCCYSCYIDLHRKECIWTLKQKIQFITSTKKSPIKKYCLSDNKQLSGKRKIFNSIFVLDSSWLIFLSSKCFYYIKKHSRYGSKF